MPYRYSVGTFDVPSEYRAINMYRSSRWGAPRLRAATFPFPPRDCRLLPFRRQSLQPLFNPLAARARPCALTLNPCALSLIAAATLKPSLSLATGFALPAVARAPPRFPAPLCAPLRSAHTSQPPNVDISVGRVVSDASGATPKSTRRRFTTSGEAAQKQPRRICGPLSRKEKINRYASIVHNLRPDAALTCYVLRIVVNIDAQPGKSQDFTHYGRHQ